VLLPLDPRFRGGDGMVASINGWVTVIPFAESARN